MDLNHRPSGYGPDELPGCSTPRQRLLSKALRVYTSPMADATPQLDESEAALSRAAKGKGRKERVRSRPKSLFLCFTGDCRDSKGYPTLHALRWHSNGSNGYRSPGRPAGRYKRDNGTLISRSLALLPKVEERIDLSEEEGFSDSRRSRLSKAKGSMMVNDPGIATVFKPRSCQNAALRTAIPGTFAPIRDPWRNVRRGSLLRYFR